MDITQLLAFVMQNDASDLHLSAGNPPIVRVYGSLKRLKSEDLTNESIRAMLYSIMTDEQRAEYEKDMEIDFAISFGENARFRVNAFTNRQGSAAVFRTIPSVIPSMEDLDLPSVIRRFSDLEKGIVLVTGPTGSGKSMALPGHGDVYTAEASLLQRWSGVLQRADLGGCSCRCRLAVLVHSRSRP